MKIKTMKVYRKQKNEGEPRKGSSSSDGKRTVSTVAIGARQATRERSQKKGYSGVGDDSGLLGHCRVRDARKTCRDRANSKE